MRKISVKVIPNARTDRIVEEEGRTKVYLKVPAVEGKANKALIGFLAEHFHVKKSQITLIKGLTTREKVIEIRE